MSHARTTRRSARRLATAVAVAGLLALGSTACTSSPDVATTAKSGSDTGTSDSAAKDGGGKGDAAKGGGAKGGKAAAPKAKVGDTLALKGQEDGSATDVTVRKIVDPAAGADEFTRPGAGKRFVSVQFEIKNTGSKSYEDAPGNGAKVIDSEGQAYDSVIADTKAGPSLNDVKLPTGDRRLGYITFEVPKGAKLAAVQFGMESGFAQTGQWTVG